MEAKGALKRLGKKVHKSDKALVENAGQLRNPALRQGMRLMSALGEPWTLYPVAGLVGARWVATGRKADALTLALSIGGSGLLNKVLKLVVERPRPRHTLHRQDPSGSSFPSNHITMSLCAYGALAYLALARQEKRPVRWRLSRLGLVALLIVAIGYSRIFLGVHYPSDVVGGWLVGVGWLGLCLLLKRYILT
ncbi:MAG: phosphatase PAP2 family protein [Chloroflexia bacterium]